MNSRHILILILSVFFTLGFGSLGAVFTAPEIQTWYAQLNKPVFNPPSWIFGPVWSLLYLMMGITLYFIFTAVPSKEKRNATVFFFVQFALNFFWSLIFFRLHETGWALVEIIAMWLAIIGTIYTTRKLKPLAAYLLIPYLLWVSFASVLNGAIWWLN